MVAGGDLLEDAACEGGHEGAAQEVLEGAGAGAGVEAAVDQGVEEGGGEAGLEGVGAAQAVGEGAQLDRGDGPQGLGGERAVGDDGHAREQGRSEVFGEGRLDRGAQLGEGGGAVAVELGDGVGGEVAGEDDEGVAKVDDAAVAVDEVALVEHLIKQVHDGEVGLLALVEEDEGVGALADGLAEYAALAVAEVAGRGADQAGDAVGLRELAEGDGEELALAAVELLGEGEGGLGLADAAGADEQEDGDRCVGVADADVGHADGLGDDLDGVVLAAEAGVEALLEVEEGAGGGAGELGGGDAGPVGEDAGDGVAVDLGVDQRGVASAAAGEGVGGVEGRGGAGAVIGGGAAEGRPGGEEGGDRGAFGLPALVHGGVFGGEGGDLGGEGGEAEGVGLAGLVEVALEGGVFGPGVAEAVVEAGERGGWGLVFDLHAGGGGVEQVDGLVGELATGEVAVGELGGGDDGGVGDDDPVLALIQVAQAAEHANGGREVGGLDFDRLEAAGEGGVFFEVAAIFGPGGGGDGPQFAAGELGFEEVGELALFAGADEHVGLVDEEDDRCGGGLDLGEELHEAALELAADAGAGGEEAEVEAVELAAGEGVGDLAGDDGEGEALDEGGLADAGLADDDRAVFAAAREDVDELAQLGVAAEDGVDGAAAGAGGERGGEAIEGGGFAGGRGCGGGWGGWVFGDEDAEGGEGEVELGQGFAGVAAGAGEQGEEEVAGGDAAAGVGDGGEQPGVLQQEEQAFGEHGAAGVAAAEAADDGLGGGEGEGGVVV